MKKCLNSLFILFVLCSSALVAQERKVSDKSEAKKAYNTYVLVNEELNENSVFEKDKVYSFTLENCSDKKTKDELIQKIKSNTLDFINVLKEEAYDHPNQNFTILFAKSVTVKEFSSEFKKIGLRLRPSRKTNSEKKNMVQKYAAEEK